jgi:hypothetical protein
MAEDRGTGVVLQVCPKRVPHGASFVVESSLNRPIAHIVICPCQRHAPNAHRC